MRNSLISLHRRPGTSQESSWILDGHTFASLVLEGQASPFLDVTFEQARERLEKGLRCYSEPDGSFALGGVCDAIRWEIVGMLSDAGTTLSHVDFQGRAPAKTWLDLFQVLVAPAEDRDNIEDHMIFLKDAGRFFPVSSFLNYVETDPS